MRRPRMGNSLLDEQVWKTRLGAWCARRDAVLFSPAPFWSLRAPARVVVAHHDCIYRHFPRYLGKWFVRRWLAMRAERFLTRCTLVITESLHARSEIVAFSGINPTRVAMIPAWLPPEYTREAARRAAARVRLKYGIPERFWLYVGGYDYRKNVGFLVEAYARANEARKCPPLVLAGRIPGVGRAPVCDVAGVLARTRVPADLVLRPGFVAEEDMPGLYGAAELTVYPSLHEGFGLPPLESMGCGCPAIVADNSSLPEVVEDPGYRFDTSSPAGLMALLTRAAENRLPLNPSFRPERFSELAAMAKYLNVLRPVVA